VIAHDTEQGGFSFALPLENFHIIPTG